MFAGYNNDYRESKVNYNRKSMLPLLKCQITPLRVITHRLRTTDLRGLGQPEMTSCYIKIVFSLKQNLLDYNKVK